MENFWAPATSRVMLAVCSVIFLCLVVTHKKCWKCTRVELANIKMSSSSTSSSPQVCSVMGVPTDFSDYTRGSSQMSFWNKSAGPEVPRGMAASVRLLYALCEEEAGWVFAVCVPRGWSHLAMAGANWNIVWGICYASNWVIRRFNCVKCILQGLQSHKGLWMSSSPLWDGTTLRNADASSVVNRWEFA